MLNSLVSLKLQAYATILKKIINTEYKPGQRISEKELGEELNIGRTPVREALLQLRQEGLINVVPQSGTYITKIDLEVAVSARFIRESIEIRIIKEAAATAPASPRLHTILNNQKFFSKQKEFERFFAEDEAFHEEFYRMTNHQQVWDWLQTINMQLNRFRMLRLKVVELPWKTLIDEHQKILTAVEQHKPAEAERLIENHLHLMLDEEGALLKAFPNYFTNLPTAEDPE
ncbi:GntR family transcriptional regulator [Liquorilactobacillus satsumensis]|uniref:GntR family transcriptional regulator n=1 Tax=Liquorilactobacillus satsumensis TaxID=259059 RepID=UPI0021C27738|nr:GntR family transcriptional regulator [Liquorilactobacillus satsumensis]MCP9312468.1 GntR family transcriptional regulator [Liquorilactobacillus satsumensis]MCP9359757.1 GntR family transcriptional regulator [Liquorilactobacillus satsumensis]